MQFLVIESLNHGVFLGNNLLTSKNIYLKTQNEIIFNKITSKKFNSSRLSQNDKFVVVKLLNQKKDISLSYIDIDTETDEPITIDKQQQIQTITTIPKTNTFCNAYIETPTEREKQYSYNEKKQK